MSDVVPIKLDLNEIEIGESAEGVEEDDVSQSKKITLRRLVMPLAIGLAAIFVLAIILFSISRFWKADDFLKIGKPSLDNVAFEESQADAHGAVLDQSASRTHGDGVARRVEKPSKKDHAETKTKEHEEPGEFGRVEAFDKAAYYYLNPVVAAAESGGRTVRVNMSIAFETDKTSAEILLEHGYDINEQLELVINSMEAAAFDEWDAPRRICSLLHRKLELMLPDANIKTILVQDFIVL